jgi:hypothetical protein
VRRATWVVNAVLEPPEQWTEIMSGCLPCYESRAEALAAHPDIARMPVAEQDHYLRCIGVEQDD